MSAFDNKKYLEKNLEEMEKRIKKFDKTYIEVGGHLLEDNHASRVLPGFKTDNKMQLVKKIKNKCFVYCVNANTLDKGKTWGNTTKTIEEISFKEIELLKKKGLELLCVVLGMYDNKKKSKDFKKKLEKKGYLVITTSKIKEYPKNFGELFGRNGFRKQPFVDTEKDNIIVTGVGASSGKLFFCLSQIYHQEKRKVNAGYFKIETFPVWDLPTKHPLNLAYEAATADIQDRLTIDYYHEKKYGVTSVNYNRDIEAFGVLKKVINKITSEKNYLRKYFSPTDMGINVIKKCIKDEEKTKKACVKEILWRQKSFHKKYYQKQVDKKTVKRIDEIVEKIKK